MSPHQRQKEKRIYYRCKFCEKVIPHTFSILFQFGFSFCCQQCIMQYSNILVDEGKSLMEKYTDEEIALAESSPINKMPWMIDNKTSKEKIEDSNENRPRD